MIATFWDVRALDATTLEQPLLTHREGLVVAASQMSAFGRCIRDREMIAVVPDFLEYARLLSVGQGRQLIAKAGGLKRIWHAAMRAGLSVLRQPLKAATTDFWLVAEVLLRFDLALLRDFHGAIVLHPYLTDFAAGLQREAFLRQFYQLAQPWQYVGFWTYQFSATMSALARLGIAPTVVIFSTAQRDVATSQALSEAVKNTLFGRTNYLVDLEPATVTPHDNFPAWLQSLPVYGVVRAVSSLSKPTPTHP
ncbi:MAG: hypothetical protein ACPL7D_07795 [Candidatus Sumerlaeaceae bacterium]|jgi:hypothetical protein